MTLQFVGDISLNGLFCDPQYHPALTGNMAEVASHLGECALRVGNWESPLWGDGGMNVLKQPRVCTTADAATCILPLRLDVGLMANNHAYDCLEQGFGNTVRFFEEHGLGFLGASVSAAAAQRPLVLSRQGLTFGLLNYVGRETNPCIPDRAGVHVNFLDEERAVAEVRELAARVDIVVVNLHWGTEFVRYPHTAQRRLARRLVEAGARVVAGHHSHCLQGYERWENGCIFYSLGNFLFGGLNGRESRPWPRISRQTGVGICEVSRTGVERVAVVPLLQEGHVLRRDDTGRRRRMQERLNRPLGWPESRYRRLWRRELVRQWALGAPVRFIGRSGGLLQAFRRFRWQHVIAAATVLKQKEIPNAK